MPQADAIPVISYQARSYNVFDEQTKEAAAPARSAAMISDGPRPAPAPTLWWSTSSTRRCSPYTIRSAA